MREMADSNNRETMERETIEVRAGPSSRYSMYGVDSTSNDQVLAPDGLHDVGLSQSDILGPLPSAVSLPLPLLDRQVDQPNIHSVAGRPSHDVRLFCGYYDEHADAYIFGTSP
ncbi:hypothetical protein BDR05DRAFT_1006536 [Suillus weaverae]|nr:hypothetical protein BDR05DRAFT_1006536 [Suillus weaverae]